MTRSCSSCSRTGRVRIGLTNGLFGVGVWRKSRHYNTRVTAPRLELGDVFSWSCPSRSLIWPLQTCRPSQGPRPPPPPRLRWASQPRLFGRGLNRPWPSCWPASERLTRVSWPSLKGMAASCGSWSAPGPSAFRIAGIREQLSVLGLSVTDKGDIPSPIPEAKGAGGAGQSRSCCPSTPRACPQACPSASPARRAFRPAVCSVGSFRGRPTLTAGRLGRDHRVLPHLQELHQRLTHGTVVFDDQDYGRHFSDHPGVNQSKSWWAGWGSNPRPIG